MTTATDKIGVYSESYHNGETIHLFKPDYLIIHKAVLLQDGVLWASLNSRNETITSSGRGRLTLSLFVASLLKKEPT